MGITRIVGLVGLVAGCSSKVVGTGDPSTTSSSSSSSGGASGTNASSGASGSGGLSSGSSGTTGAKCVNVDGLWNVTGTCGDDSCSITQTECDLTLVCDIAGVLPGSVEGTSIRYTNVIEGVKLNCRGSVSNGSATGSCTPEASSGTSGLCTFRATHD